MKRFYRTAISLCVFLAVVLFAVGPAAANYYPYVEKTIGDEVEVVTETTTPEEAEDGMEGADFDIGSIYDGNGLLSALEIRYPANLVNLDTIVCTVDGVIVEKNNYMVFTSPGIAIVPFASTMLETQIIFPATPAMAYPLGIRIVAEEVTATTTPEEEVVIEEVVTEDEVVTEEETSIP